MKKTNGQAIDHLKRCVITEIVWRTDEFDLSSTLISATHLGSWQELYSIQRSRLLRRPQTGAKERSRNARLRIKSWARPGMKSSHTSDLGGGSNSSRGRGKLSAILLPV